MSENPGKRILENLLFRGFLYTFTKSLHLEAAPSFSASGLCGLPVSALFLCADFLMIHLHVMHDFVHQIETMGITRTDGFKN